MRALLLLALTCARAGGCMYGGRWWADGAGVRVRDACLRCRCAGGALACARAACAPAPDPPPRRCALLHRRDACCPEIHCPDGIKSLELNESTAPESDVVTPATPGNACVEAGGVFAAGSALSARAACEQCFCLRGARRCVRPRCLPPPPGCAPRPAPGACCPQRYYCEPAPLNHTTPATSTPSTSVQHRHDCEVNGEWVSEGERVSSATAGGDNCSQCFCLRGRLRCQQLACAPALRGCSPLLRAGHCCPHQYRCPHDTESSLSIVPVLSDNSLISSANERSFRTSSSTKVGITTKTSSSALPTRNRSAAPPPTTKVKRKTDDTPPPTTSGHKPIQNTTEVTAPSTTEVVELSTASTPLSAISMSTPPPTPATEQPEGSLKIIINGTINCTAELSSGIMNDNTVANETIADSEAQAREPQRSEAADAPTSSFADIITERSDFEDGESFTVNVSSSLRANNSHAARPPPPPAPAAPADIPIVSIANTSSAKEDYDFDYTEPTLPPSLPNLKIIPFVAADAVLDEELSPKEESVPYPALSREDNFPVYYPSRQEEGGGGVAVFANRREDVYSPAQYPVFVSEPARPALYSELLAESEQPVAKTTPAATTRDHPLRTPSVNLFSPPVETEGGFIPKGPGIIDEYYAVYPSTPPPVPHLTTSMQINPNTPDAECTTSEGGRLREGETVRVGCAVCACEWAELRCEPLRCRTPARCRRRAAAAPTAPALAGADTSADVLDLCCGKLICDQENITSTAPLTSTTQRPASTSAEPSTPAELPSGLIPFDPPPDRSVPEPTVATTSTTKPNSESASNKNIDNTNMTTPSSSTTEKLKSSDTTESTKTPLIKISSSSPTTPPHELRPSGVPPSPTPAYQLPNNTDHHSQEYEDEEDDEGFSFGSVLKLLLSDSYDTTTSSPKRKPTTAAIRPTTAPTTTISSPPTLTTKTLPLRPAVTLTPLPSYPYIPPKKVFVPNTVNRIDHLVLGEATAIRKSTPRPTLPPKRFSTRASTRRPEPATTRITAPASTTRSPETLHYTPPAPRPAAASAGASGGGGGLFKLAGCNIYGRMYRVGRIIAELSTPCQECRCTELGVQCAPLRC